MNEVPKTIQIIYDIILGPIYTLVPMSPTENYATGVIGEIDTARANRYTENNGKRK